MKRIAVQYLNWFPQKVALKNDRTIIDTIERFKKERGSEWGRLKREVERGEYGIFKERERKTER